MLIEYDQTKDQWRVSPQALNLKHSRLRLVQLSRRLNAMSCQCRMLPRTRRVRAPAPLPRLRRNSAERWPLNDHLRPQIARMARSVSRSLKAGLRNLLNWAKAFPLPQTVFPSAGFLRVLLPVRQADSAAPTAASPSALPDRSLPDSAGAPLLSICFPFPPANGRSAPGRIPRTGRHGAYALPSWLRMFPAVEHRRRLLPPADHGNRRAGRGKSCAGHDRA